MAVHLKYVLSWSGDGAGVQTERSQGRDHAGRARESEARPQRVDPTSPGEIRAERPPQPRHPRHLPPGVQRHGVGLRGRNNKGNCYVTMCVVKTLVMELSKLHHLKMFGHSFVVILELCLF